MGAKIFFADVDKFSGQMTPFTIQKIIKEKIKKIKVLVSMYMGGFPENVEKIYDLKKKYKFFLIEDSVMLLEHQSSISRKLIELVHANLVTLQHFLCTCKDNNLRRRGYYNNQ